MSFSASINKMIHSQKARPVAEEISFVIYHFKKRTHLHRLNEKNRPIIVLIAEGALSNPLHSRLSTLK
jgi:hypothetical protein